MGRTLLVVLLSLVALSWTQELPTLPDSFTVGVEVNILEKNYTSRRNDFFDYENNRARFDIYTVDNVYTEIFDLNKDLRYEIIDFETCTVHAWNDSRGILTDSDHHLMHTADLFELGSDVPVQYQGTERIRGIWCDLWTRDITVQYDDDSTSDYIAKYYFSVLNWEIQEGVGAEQRVPIRIEIEGTRTFANASSYNFHHIYEFVFFQVGTPANWEMELYQFFRCDHHRDITLPTLPDAFETIIEYTIVDKGYTATLYEAIDLPNRRFYRNQERKHGQVIDLWLVEKGLRYHITGGNQCTLYSLNTEEAESEIPDTTELFSFGSGFNETYQGVVDVRGIPCDHWFTEFSLEDDEDDAVYDFVLDYYFSVEEWNIIGHGLSNHRVPVRAELFGDVTYTNGTTRNIHHVYDYVHFIPGTPEDRHFEVPNNVYCKSSDVSPPLPALPTQFKVGLEITMPFVNTTIRRTDYYDYDNNKFRLDIYTNDATVIEIFDFDNELQYEIVNYELCTLKEYNNSRFQLEDPSTHHLKSVDVLYQFGSDLGEVYQGVKVIRGIPCDYWSRNGVVTQDEDGGTSNATVVWYFSVEEWILPEGDHPAGHRVPIRVEVIGTYTNPKYGLVDYPFHLNYEFVFFEIGKPMDWEINFHQFFACTAEVEKDLPTLPDAFETLIEFTIKEQGYTSTMWEAIDLPNERGAQAFYGEEGSIYYEIYAVKQQLRYEIIDRTNCTTYFLNRTQIESNYPSPSQFFVFGSEFDEKYQGVVDIRGIPCDTWRAELNYEDGGAIYNYTLYYFFSVANWSLRNKHTEHRIPVRAELSGTKTAADSTQTVMHHIYDYVNFEVGTPEDFHFQPPENVYCRSATASTVGLPELPQQFVTSIEVTNHNAKVTTRRNDYYDFPGNRFRLDIFTADHEIIEIYDFNKQLRYEIVDFNNCSINEIKDADEELEDPESHHLKSANDLYRFSSSLNYHYQGVKSVRGIPCDYWATFSNATFRGGKVDYTIAWYFSVEEWNIHEGYGNEHRVPIRAVISGTFVSANGTSNDFRTTFEFVFFQVRAPRNWEFDITNYISCGAKVQKPLPTLPDAFETAVEFTIENKNYTGSIYEAVDLKNERFYISYVQHDQQVQSIWDVKKGMRIDVRDGQCTIRALNTTKVEANLPTVYEMFHFGAAYNETYLGTTRTRGILCDHWTTRIKETHHDSEVDYRLDYYFSVEDWNMHYGPSVQHRIPVSAQISGRRTYENGTTYHFRHHYDFIHFIAGTPRESFFTVPDNLLCINEHQTISLPTLPDAFETGVEYTDLLNNFTASLFEYYDFPNNRARFDFAGPTGDETVIELPDEGVVYVIVNHTKCQEYDIDPKKADHLPSVAELFAFGDKYDEHYQGTRYVRGIPCEIWKAHVVEKFDQPTEGGGTAIDMIVTYSFSVPWWDMQGHYGTHASRVPVQAVIAGYLNTTSNARIPLHLVYEFVDFNPGPVHPEVFVPRDQWNCGRNNYTAIIMLMLDVGDVSSVNLVVIHEKLVAALDVGYSDVSVFKRSGNAVLVELRAKDQDTLLAMEKKLYQLYEDKALDVGYPLSSVSVTTNMQCGQCKEGETCHFGQCVKMKESSSGVSGLVVLIIIDIIVVVFVALGVILYFYLKKKKQLKALGARSYGKHLDEPSDNEGVRVELEKL